MCALIVCTVLERNIFWLPTYQNAVFIFLSVWNIHHLNTITTQNTIFWSLKLCQNAACSYGTLLRLWNISRPIGRQWYYIKDSNERITQPSGFSCLRVAQDPKYNGDIFTYSGPDVMDVFFNHLKEQEEFVSDVLSKVVKMNTLSQEEQQIHMEAKNCKLRGNWFEHDKVRHHDHITGCCIWPYCNRCNLQLKFIKCRNDRKRKLIPTNHGSLKKLCRDV